MTTLQEQIGENVRAHRERVGLTQAEMGRRMGEAMAGKGWTRQAVSQIESGARQLTASELLWLAAVLSVTVPQLYESDRAVTLPSGRTMGPEVLDALTAASNADRDRHLRLRAPLRGLRRAQQLLNQHGMLQAVELARLEAIAAGAPDPQPDGSAFQVNAFRLADRLERESREAGTTELPPVELDEREGQS